MRYNNISLNKRDRNMRSEPDWLEIDQYLYPQTLLQKLIQVQGVGLPVPIHLSVTLTYDSINRCIDITELLSNVINKSFSPSHYEVSVNHDQKYTSLGFYPFKEPILLTQEFVDASNVLLRIQEVDEDGNRVDSKVKKSGEKSVKEILQRVAAWRKIHQKSKCTLQEAAQMVGCSKNTLQDYYIQIKLGTCSKNIAQKYGFNFSQYFDEPFKHVRKFVKDHHSTKQSNQNPVLSMLQKYQPK